MITSISLENFKSWRRIERMRFARITGLFGANSSGNTSILQWLLMLKQTVESSDRVQPLQLGDERSLVELGSFRDLIHAHALPGAVAWRIEWTLGHPRQIVDMDRGPNAVVLEDDKIALSCRVGAKEVGDQHVEELTYDFSGWQFGYDFVGPGSEYALWSRAPGEPQAVEGASRRWQSPAALRQFPTKPSPTTSTPTSMETTTTPAPDRFYGFPYPVKLQFPQSGFLSDLVFCFEQLCNGIYYLGPLREFPLRHYSWAGAKPDDVGKRGERAIDALLEARRGKRTIQHAGQDISVEQMVAIWLRKLNLIDDFSVAEIKEGSGLYHVLVRQTPASAQVLLTDVGFGISQVLPVLVLCYFVPQGSTIILEQPEIHLHPLVQARLGDVLIDVAKTRNVQIIVESHSEHLLRRLQRRIAEAGESGPTTDDVALYFCEMRDGESHLLELELDSFGNIVNWPEDFFGDQFGEMAAMAEAVAGRRQQEAG